MSLFDDIDRIAMRVRRENESAFAYLNTSARLGIRAIRDLLDGWFEHIPVAMRNDIRARFRKASGVDHQSAFFELYWHELLRCSGYEVRIHPPVPNANTAPDFLTLRNGIPQFYLEATLATAPRSDQAAERRLAELHDTLNRMDSPDFFWDIQLRGSPEENIPGRIIRQRLEGWSRQLNFEEISRLYQEEAYDALPVLT